MVSFKYFILKNYKKNKPFGQWEWNSYYKITRQLEW